MDKSEGDYEAYENKSILPKLTGPHTPRDSVPRALVSALVSGGWSWSWPQLQQTARKRQKKEILCFELCQSRLCTDLDLLQPSWTPDRVWGDGVGSACPDTSPGTLEAPWGPWGLQRDMDTSKSSPRDTNIPTGSQGNKVEKGFMG